ncbi:vascular cell adhesion protein 1-like isoform X2 [Notothenia coriiceps]|uniref:Vascular cell adhesion protein 1-like isoform X2 n=1 Tax=Notothenia coriiceps TaxID=8208 RepID=A0A6I9NS97_9TELE|nr:PREDICTED: vascular cell adhesion protein 1-like isoform X2 [Notothenia coriiceps]
MFFHLILLVVSVITFLPSPHELPLACDQNCADKPRFTPSRLVAQFGKPTSALCSVCQPGCHVTLFDIENPIGTKKKNGTEITWTVNNMTEWINSTMCYYTNDTTNVQCCSVLPITVYKPPDNVSFSVQPDEPMSEGRQYTLQCEVWDVAPVKNLTVTFYRGQTALGHTQSSNTDEKPVSEVFTWNITSTKEDDGVQFWCEAKLELGADGPQPPPVGKSENVTAAVHYKPQREAPPIIITEGNRLTLNCSSVGNPPPSYTWTPPSRITSPFDGSVFIIESITRKDEGSYTCYVSNVKGSITVEFNVTVQGLPSTTLPTTTTPPTTMITTTSTPTTTKTTTATTTTTRTTPNRGTSSKRLHSFMMCFLLLFSALV